MLDRREEVGVDSEMLDEPTGDKGRQKHHLHQRAPVEKPRRKGEGCMTKEDRENKSQKDRGRGWGKADR